MKEIPTISAKEFKDALRNRWIIFTTALLAVFSITLTLFGAPAPNIDASGLAITVVSLSSLSIYLIPLIAIMLSYDAIVGEVERGTLSLLLTYPVSKTSILLGKFLGHICILSFTVIVGFGCAATLSIIQQGVPNMQDLLAFIQLILSSILLGSVFIAISYMISGFVKERATAAGIGLFIWIFFVLVFDLLLIILISNFGDYIDERAVNILMMLNPTDIYRIVNLTGFENVRMLSGLGSVTEYMALNNAQMLSVLAVWLFAPLIVANIFFKKKEF